MGLTKTLTKSRDRIDHSRDTAAGLLSRTATRVRHGSRRASRVIDHGGTRAADTLETAAERVSRDDQSFVRRNPARLLLVFGVIAAVLAVFMVKRAPGHRDDADDEDF